MNIDSFHKVQSELPVYEDLHPTPEGRIEERCMIQTGDVTELLCLIYFWPIRIGLHRLLSRRPRAMHSKVLV